MKNKTTVYFQKPSIISLQSRLPATESSQKVSTLLNRMIQNYDQLIKQVAPQLRIDEYKLIQKISAKIPDKAFLHDDALEFLKESQHHCEQIDKGNVSAFISKVSRFSELERKALMDIFLRTRVKHYESEQNTSI